MLFMTEKYCQSNRKEGEMQMMNKIIYPAEKPAFLDLICQAYQTNDWETVMRLSRQADEMQLAAFRKYSLEKAQPAV